MAFTTNNVYEAIGRAAMMAERVGSRYLVASFRGRWRAMRDCHHVTKDRIVWRSWKTRAASPIVKDTEQHRKLARTLYRKQAAEKIGITVGQFDYAAKVYGWKTRTYGMQLNVEAVREAMKTMTATEYAEQVGVYPTRIYALCKEFNIPRPVRALRGKPRAKGPFRRKDTPGISKDMLEEGLKTMSALEFAKKHDISVSWVYLMCRKHGIERKIANRSKA